MSDKPTPDGAWENVWIPLLGPEDNLNLPVLKSLLFDYGSLLHDISSLYHYLTEGDITHPQTPVHEVMEAADLVVANTLDSNIRDLLNDLLDSLDGINTETAEVQLEALLNRISYLYERGIDE